MLVIDKIYLLYYNHKLNLTLKLLGTLDLLLHMPALSTPKYSWNLLYFFSFIVTSFWLLTKRIFSKKKKKKNCLIHVYLLWRVFMSAQYDYVMQIRRNINSDHHQ